MSGEEDLEKLLTALQPSLCAEEYVFCTARDLTDNDSQLLQPIATYREEEGLSLVLERGRAEAAGLDYESIFKCISLKVHSSLDAVGLTAAVAGRLAENGISANMIAAYHHDHVYVPKDKAELALELLKEL